MTLSNLPLYLVGAVFAYIAWAVVVPVGSTNQSAPKATAAEVAAALASTQPVLLDFSASWCGPCRQVAPTVHELSMELRGRAKVLKVDVDEQQALAMRYEVHSIPCFIVVKQGREVAREVGCLSKAELRTLLGL